MFSVFMDVMDERNEPVSTKCFYEHEGISYSPISYVEELSGQVEDDPQSKRMIAISEAYGGERQICEPSSPQPLIAINVPNRVVQAYRGKNFREMFTKLINRECFACGDPTTNPKEICGPVTNSCRHEWDGLLIFKDCLSNTRRTK